MKTCSVDPAKVFCLLIYWFILLLLLSLLLLWHAVFELESVFQTVHVRNQGLPTIEIEFCTQAPKKLNPRLISWIFFSASRVKVSKKIVMKKRASRLCIQIFLEHHHLSKYWKKTPICRCMVSSTHKIVCSWQTNLGNLFTGGSIKIHLFPPSS